MVDTMRVSLLSLLAVAALFAASDALTTKDVNMMIGTGGDGYGVAGLQPGPQRPLGMARVGPDTCKIGGAVVPWRMVGGYSYMDSEIRAFSHTHMMGPGVLEMGYVATFPSSQVPKGRGDVDNYAWRSAFSHEHETSRPGYYQVLLLDHNIDVELTAGTYSGMHRYTWHEQEKPHVILFPMSHTLASTNPIKPLPAHEVSVTIDAAKNEVYGRVVGASGFCHRVGDCHVYFSARLHGDVTITGSGVYEDGHVSGGATKLDSKDVQAGAWVQVQQSKVEMSLGISWISVDQARANRQADIKDRSFDAVRTESEAAWAKEMAAVDVQGNDRKDDLTIFATAYFHALTAPTLLSETNRKYLDVTNKVMDLPAGQNAWYTELSIWDMHRTQFSLLVAFKPDVAVDIVRSLLVQDEHGKDLARWSLVNGYAGSMVGNHAVVLFADAYFKGLGSKFDAKEAYEFAKIALTKKTAHNARADLDHYLSKGYVRVEQSHRAASETCEYAYDDHVVGLMGKALGDADAQAFLDRGKNYRNVWDPTEKFICPRNGAGDFDCPEVKTNVEDKRYVEGDAWHYRFWAHWDVPGLIELFGDAETYVEQLDIFHRKSREYKGNLMPNPYYWSGNEPDLATPWQFAWANRADLTQEHTRWVMQNRYTTQPDGVSGNDDYGTLSSWGVFAAAGFYPLAGTDTYMLGSTTFPKTVFHRPGGDLTIIGHGATSKTFYVTKIQLNGAAVDPCIGLVKHADLFKAGGSTLEMWMSSTPVPCKAKTITSW